MGQALDRDGNVLAECVGDNKESVFKGLQKLAPDAHELRIRTLEKEAARLDPNRGEFQRDLESLINRHCQENGSNTPDFILAEYMVDCLRAFERTSKAREKWYGKELSIGGGNALPTGESQEALS